MGAKSWLLLLLLALVSIGLMLRLLWSGGDAPPIGPVVPPPAHAGGSVPAAGEHGEVAAVPDVDREPAPPSADPAAAITLTGSVDEAGAFGIAGATVALFAAPLPPDASAPLATATADDEGKFRIAGPAGPGPWVLRATAPGFLPGTVEVADAGQRIRLRLRRVVEVFGRVLDKASSVPIAGAEVSDGRTTVQCDALGRYELTVTIQHGYVSLKASARGFAERTESLRLTEPQRTELDFRLSPTVPLTVQVIDRETRAPIAGAEVRKFSHGDVLMRSDADGRFVVDVGDGQQLMLSLRADGYCPLGWRWQVVATDLPSPRLPLTREGRVEGRVTDAGGPVAAASVQLAAADRPTFDRHWPAAECEAWQLPGSVIDEDMHPSASTDTDGRFAMSVRPEPEPRWVVVAGADKVRTRSEPFVLAAAGETVRIDVLLAAGGTIRGSVTYNGKPFAGDVWWRQGDNANGRAEIDAAGDYWLQRVPPGAVEVRVRGKGGHDPGQAAIVQVLAGEEVRLDFAWQEQMATISGRLTQATGEPVAEWNVNATTEGGDRMRFFRATTDAEGRYSLEVPTGGTYALSVRRAEATVRVAGVRPNATGVDFVLPTIGVLRLRLVEAATGAPLSMGGPGFSRVAWRESGQIAFQSTLGDVDSTGLVVLRVPVGMVDVSLGLQRAGYVPRTLFGLPVTASDAGGEVRVEFARGAELRLSVSGDAPFTPEARKGHVLFVLEDAQVPQVRGPFAEQGGESNIRINGVNMWLAEPGLMHQMPDFGESGRATVTGLAPGRYRLAVFPDDIVFAPSPFAVGENGADVELRWRHR